MLDINFSGVIDIVKVSIVDILVFDAWNILDEVEADGMTMLQGNVLEDIMEKVLNTLSPTNSLSLSDIICAKTLALKLELMTGFENGKVIKLELICSVKQRM